MTVKRRQVPEGLRPGSGMVVSVRLPQSAYDELQRLAGESGLPMATLARVFINAGLDHTVEERARTLLAAHARATIFGPTTCEAVGPN